MTTRSHRRFFAATVMGLLALQASAAPRPDKLSPDTKAPAHALSSAGLSRTLRLPILRSGQTPAHVSLLKPGGPKSPASTSNSAEGPASQPVDTAIQREEMTSFKEVNGETVRVVVGSYGYESPEGLPVSFKYMADDNGNAASFTIGKAAGGGGAGGGKGAGGSKPGGAGAGGGGRGSGAGGGAGGAKGGAGGAKGGAGGGGKMYLPPK